MRTLTFRSRKLCAVANGLFLLLASHVHAGVLQDLFASASLDNPAINTARAAMLSNTIVAELPGGNEQELGAIDAYRREQLITRVTNFSLELPGGPYATDLAYEAAAQEIRFEVRKILTCPLHEATNVEVTNSQVQALIATYLATVLAHHPALQGSSVVSRLRDFLQDWHNAIQGDRYLPWLKQPVPVAPFQAQLATFGAVADTLLASLEATEFGIPIASPTNQEEIETSIALNATGIAQRLFSIFVGKLAAEELWRTGYAEQHGGDEALFFCDVLSEEEKAANALLQERAIQESEGLRAELGPFPQSAP